MSRQRFGLASLAAAGLGLVMSSSAMAAMTSEMDGDHWFELSGLLQFDEVVYDGSSDSQNYPSGSNVRRARVALNGGVGQDWSYTLRTDLSDDRSAVTGSDVLDAYVKYTGMENMFFMAGQVKPVFGMENQTAASDLWFMERSLGSTAMHPGYGLGLVAGVQGETLNFVADVFHGNDKVNQTRTGSEPLGYSARLTFVPVQDDEHVWHVGASYLAKDTHDKDGGTVTFSSVPELTSRGNATLSTGALGSVHEYQQYGFEAAVRWHDVTAQAEYFRLHIDRSATAGGDLTYKGYYAQLAYSLTGETRPYDFATGTFGRVTPVAKDGAWELVARHSFLDLRDKSTGAPGSEHNTSLGVNWWYNDNVSFAADYVHSNIPRTGNTSADIDGFGFRVQVVF